VESFEPGQSVAHFIRTPHPQSTQARTSRAGGAGWDGVGRAFRSTACEAALRPRPELFCACYCPPHTPAHLSTATCPALQIVALGVDTYLKMLLQVKHLMVIVVPSQPASPHCSGGRACAGQPFDRVPLFLVPPATIS